MTGGPEGNQVFQTIISALFFGDNMMNLKLQVFETIVRLSWRFPGKVSLNSGDVIHTGFLAFHSILDTSSHQLRPFPMVVAFPRTQYYDRSASLWSPQPPAGPAYLEGEPTTAVPRFRVVVIWL
jgi:hypothetical protein